MEGNIISLLSENSKLLIRKSSNPVKKSDEPKNNAMG